MLAPFSLVILPSLRTRVAKTRVTSSSLSMIEKPTELKIITSKKVNLLKKHIQLSKVTLIFSAVNIEKRSSPRVSFILQLPIFKAKMHHYNRFILLTIISEDGTLEENLSKISDNVRKWISLASELSELQDFALNSKMQKQC